MFDLDGAPLSEAVVRVLAEFASRESATVDEVILLAQRLPAVLSDGKAPQPSVSLMALASAGTTAPVRPAVSIDKSVSDDTVTCLCCGRSFTMLKRHIKAEHGLTEASYRMQFGLDEDHPLVAPNYSIRKAEHAKRIGLGKYERDDMPARASLPSA